MASAIPLGKHGQVVAASCMMFEREQVKDIPVPAYVTGEQFLVANGCIQRTQ